MRHGWGGSFGTSAVPRLSRKGAKRWGMQRVHPSLAWTGTKGQRLSHPIQHYVDRDISDVLRRLDRYSSAKAARELGYRARPYREALVEAIDWFRAAGMVL